MKIILTLAASIVFVTYVLFIWIRFGVQKSISDSYYRLKPVNLGYLFTLFTVGFAYPIAMVAHNVWITPAAFLIILVGVARSFKDNKIWRIAHMTGAYVGVSLATIGIWAEYNLWYITVSFILCAGLMIILNIKNKIWWVEIVAFISVLIAVTVEQLC